MSDINSPLTGDDMRRVATMKCPIVKRSTSDRIDMHKIDMASGCTVVGEVDPMPASLGIDSPRLERRNHQNCPWILSAWSTHTCCSSLNHHGMLHVPGDG